MLSPRTLLFLLASFTAIFLSSCATTPPAGSSVDMVKVAGGSFQMGRADGEDDEKPMHKVTLTGFSIGATEVTQAQYKAVMHTNPSNHYGDNLPVEQVSWFDAVNFCNQSSLVDKLTPYYTIEGTSVTTDEMANGYRLPTEAQWEYAAQGGSKSHGFTYAGSNEIETVAWYGNNSDGKTHPVANKAPNELGLYDMGGNAWEWCWDWYGAYTTEVQTDPAGAVTGSFRVIRGGGFNSRAHLASPSGRYNFEGDVDRDLGFRVVRP